MGDWRDYAESNGYSAGDPAAIDKILDRWDRRGPNGDEPAFVGNLCQVCGQPSHYAEPWEDDYDRPVLQFEYSISHTQWYICHGMENAHEATFRECHEFVEQLGNDKPIHIWMHMKCSERKTDEQLRQMYLDMQEEE